MLIRLLLGLLPLTAAAQSGTSPGVAAPKWGAGIGLGNGLEAHGGYYGPHLLAFGRVRGKWWGPANGPGPSLFSDAINTRSRQVEVAALVGYPLALGRATFYAATGVAYLSGRQLGEYRYSLRESGLLSTSATHYYSYRDYQALGLPVEAGIQVPVWPGGPLRLGLAGQANFNPQQTVYCLLTTIWVGLNRQP